MKKNFLKVLLVSLIINFSVAGITASANSLNVVDFLSQERIVIKEGIELHKRTALTAFNGNLEDKRPQNMQALIRPADSGGTKVVNWARQNFVGNWSLSTVANIAKDYEAKHPGWIVLGGVNGDFYGINSPDANYGETNNSMVSDGFVYRPEHGQFVLGLKADGSYVTGKPGIATNMTLEIFNSLDIKVGEYTVNKVNTTPSTNEIALILNDIADPSTIITTDAKVISFSNQLYRRTFDNDPSPSRTHKYLAKGTVAIMVDSEPLTALTKPEFKVVSNNATFNEFIQIGHKIVAHYKLTGTFSDVVDATGYSHQVLLNGAPQYKSSTDAFIKGPHPRTAMGFKADGSMVLLMVDGRASTENRNGVSLYELGEILRRFDCVQGYNFDGGGSSSLVVRNAAGGFTTVNYPSDGFDRSVANALLIVTRDPGIAIEEVTDSYVKVVNKNQFVANNGEISNIQVTIDGETRTMVGQELIFDGLQSKYDYVINYKYDIIEPTRTLSAKGDKIAFETGKIAPSIERFRFINPSASVVTVDYEILDVDDSIISMKLVYGDSEMILPNLTGTLIVDDYTKGQLMEYKLEIEYSHETIDETIRTLSSEPLSLLKLKGIPQIGSFAFSPLSGSTILIDYEVIDPDLSVIDMKVMVNNQEFIMDAKSGTFTFSDLSKGTKYDFEFILNFSLYTSNEPVVELKSQKLSVTLEKTAPTITWFEVNYSKENGVKIDYSITDSDDSRTSIALTYGDVTIPLTNLLGTLAPTDLQEGMEYIFVLTVNYKTTDASQATLVTDTKTLYITPSGLSAGAIIGIAGSGGLATAGTVLFFLLKKKRVG